MEEIKNYFKRIRNFIERFEERDTSLIEEYNSCVRKASEEIEKKPDKWLLDNADDLRMFVYKLKGLTKLFNTEFGDNKAVDFNASNYTRLKEEIMIKSRNNRRNEVDLDF